MRLSLDGNRDIKEKRVNKEFVSDDDAKFHLGHRDKHICEYRYTNDNIDVPESPAADSISLAAKTSTSDDNR